MRTPVACFVAIVLLAGCESDAIEVAGHELVTPDGWEATTRATGPRRSAIFRAPTGDRVCLVEVLRDGRLFSERDVTAILGDASRVHGIEEGSPVELDVGGERLGGRRFAPGLLDPDWNLATTGEEVVSVYAGAFQVELVTLCVAGSDPAAHDAARADCATTASGIFR